MNQPKNSDSGVIIGSYWVPAIPGWNKTIRQKDPFSNVTYTHSYKPDVNVTLKFVKLPDLPQKESLVRSKEEFLDRVKNEIGRAKLIENQLGLKMTLIRAAPQEFHGLPSVIVEMSLEEGNSFSVKKILRFVENRNEYYLELTTTRKDKRHVQSEEGINAWNHVIKGLKHVSR